jgi:hypothetical protein
MFCCGGKLRIKSRPPEEMGAKAGTIELDPMRSFLSDGFQDMLRGSQG